MILRGRVWIFGDDINTDLIFPHTAFRVSPEEQAKLVFSDNRPGWSEMVKKGDIIIAGRNFGTGSSRPGAGVLRRLGIAALASESINGLFFRNCVGYGLPAIQCEGVREAFEEGDIAVIDMKEGTVKNERTNKILYGSKLSQSTIATLQAGGIEELLKKEGYMEK